MIKCPRCEADIDRKTLRCTQCGLDINITAPGMHISPSFGPQSALGSEPTISPRTTIDNRYEIIDKIGQGGMGEIYRVFDRTFDEIIVMKVLRQMFSGNTPILDRFKREISLVRQIKHPAVCRTYNFGVSKGLVYLTMEYIPGINLATLIKKGRPAIEPLVPVVHSILSGLGAAHSMNIVHRDLKPSNIMVTEMMRPVILDFGIAWRMDEKTSNLVQDFAGTPCYMAPEVASGLFDNRSDIFSFGIIMYELFTGRHPGEYSRETQQRQDGNFDTIIPPSLLNPAVPAYLEKIIMDCLQPDPALRFQSVYEIIGFLDRAPGNMKGTTDNNVILIVDDDESIRDILACALVNQGYRPIFATNGEEALAMSVQENPALICMDIMMPRMSGYQALDMLKAYDNTARIPVIMITALDSPKHLAAARAAGVQDYLIKPFSISEIIDKISRLVPLDLPPDGTDMCEGDSRQLSRDLIEAHRKRNRKGMENEK